LVLPIVHLLCRPEFSIVLVDVIVGVNGVAVVVLVVSNLRPI
jgi:hypothetical protein